MPPPTLPPPMLPDAPATCDVQVTLYHDKDGDGFGATDDHMLACAPIPGWVKLPGDCRDDLVQVKPDKAGSPDPPHASGTGYADPTKPGNISFDYDCDGTETPIFRCTVLRLLAVGSACSVVKGQATSQRRAGEVAQTPVSSVARLC